MTKIQKISMVKTLVGSDMEISDEEVAVYLQIASGKMLERLYPLHPDKTEYDIPERYDSIQCELCSRLILRRGGEGETSHEENGVNRVWNSTDDSDILERLTPFARV